MPYDDGTKNRFNPENRFIGDIENGLRYPFACYTKAESDARYAPKSVEVTVQEVSASVADKASQTDLAAVSAEVATKASSSDLTELYNIVRNLADVVATKANESECVDIRARLDALESDSIRITTYIASATQFVRGASATVNLSWALNKVPTTQSINNEAVTGNAKSYSNVTEDTSYLLEVSDGSTIDRKTVSVSFLNYIYYGAAADFSTVTSLNNVLSDDINRRITVTAGAGQYIIYAFPSRLGSAQFFVDSFEGGFDAPVEQTLTNSQGYSETYKIYKSTNANLGTTTVEVREV